MSRRLDKDGETYSICRIGTNLKVQSFPENMYIGTVLLEVILIFLPRVVVCISF